jgi:hypothetical protein
MKRLILALSFVLLASTSYAVPTVTLNLTWAVTNSPTIIADKYKIEEQVSGTWTTVATVPATQLTYSIPGRPTGSMASFRVTPLKAGIAGIVSNTSSCGGGFPPDATLGFSCSATVVP